MPNSTLQQHSEISTLLALDIEQALKNAQAAGPEQDLKKVSQDIASKYATQSFYAQQH